MFTSWNCWSGKHRTERVKTIAAVTRLGRFPGWCTWLLLLFTMELAIEVHLSEMAPDLLADEWLASCRCLGVRLVKGFGLVGEGSGLDESSGYRWVNLSAPTGLSVVWKEDIVWFGWDELARAMWLRDFWALAVTGSGRLSSLINFPFSCF